MNQPYGYNRGTTASRFWILCVPLTLLLCGLYFSSFSEMSDATFEIDDGLNYSKDMLLPGKMFHPHHLFFHPLGLYSYRFLSTLSDRVTPLQGLRFLNAVSGALICLMAGRIIFRSTENLTASVLTMLGLGFSRGMWLYSSVGETVALSGFFQTAAFLVASTSAACSTAALPCYLAFWTFAATVIRQDSIILAPVYALMLALRKCTARRIALFLLLFVAGTAVCYGAMWLLGKDYLYNRGNRNFGQWCILYKYYNPSSSSLRNFNAENLVLSAGKLSQALGLGMRSTPPWMLVSAFKTGWGRAARAADLAIQIALGLAWGAVFLTIAATAREALRRYKVPFLGAFSWLLIMVVFYLWSYNEYSLVYHIINLIPIFIIVGIALSLGQRGFASPLSPKMVSWAGTALVILLLLSSLFTVVPLRQEAFYERARIMKKVLRPGDLYITREFREQFLFSEMPGVHCIRILPGHRKETLLAQFDDSHKQGGRVFISALERKRWERYEPRWEPLTKEAWPRGYRLVPAPSLAIHGGEIVAKCLIEAGDLRSN